MIIHEDPEGFEEKVCNNLRGQRQCTCETWKDLTGSPQLYFVFPDLSIRAMGNYRIACRVFDMSQ